jgi:hypothetical protein
MNYKSDDFDGQTQHFHKKMITIFEISVAELPSSDIELMY